MQILRIVNASHGGVMWSAYGLGGDNLAVTLAEPEEIFAQGRPSRDRLPDVEDTAPIGIGVGGIGAGPN